MDMKQAARMLLPEFVVRSAKLLVNNVYTKQMLLKSKSKIPFHPKRFMKGFNLIGDITAETGLGQSMRIIAGMLKKSGISISIRQIDVYENLEQSEKEWETEKADRVEYGINLIHINPGEWAQLYCKLGNSPFDGHYNIAFWLWELEEFPKEWIPCINTVDEIWTPSEFISNSIRKVTDKLVITVPYTIDYLTKETFGRSYFDFPEDKFLFLTMYDAISISERKNPMAAIKAYKAAFSPKETNVGLIIKVNHLDHKNELSDLKKELNGYNNIFYIERNLVRQEVESLLATADVLISLHRAEGFGLPVAEAMFYGTPVIATNWSAVTEFIDEQSACLVDYKLICLKKNIGPYKKGNRWADADIKDAARYMKRLFEDEVYYKKIKENASKKIRLILCYPNICRIIRERVEKIYEENSIC